MSSNGIALKRKATLQSMGVSFEAARLVFDDVFALEHFDFTGDSPEPRYITIGMANGVILTVVYTERGDRIRIISARKATTHEQREYYRSQKAN